MDKADSSRQVSKWETLNRDILGLIFAKLNIRDLTMGASRVCISWFLASHNRTLWNTVDLSKLRQVDEGLWLRNILNKIIKFLGVNGDLRVITRLSRSVPKNLFFSFDSFIVQEDLMLAAERMPNIEKLVLPSWSSQSKSSYQFAFSRWKNLTTLIAHDGDFNWFYCGFQAVGENCSNLTNLKYLGDFEIYYAKQIVTYLKNLKRLSLRCSSVCYKGVLLLISGLQNLAILNLSHCKNLNWSLFPDMVTIDELVHAATQKKLDKLILCSKNDCKICKNRPICFMFWSYGSKHWRNDEIKELEF